MTNPDPSPTHPLSDWPRPLAFVLSGGGSYGATQIGMLQALANHNITPDLIVGTSVGALNGAALAADPVGAVDRLELAWADPSAASPFGQGRLRAAASFLRWRQSLCPPDRLHDLINDWLPVESFDGLVVPLGVIATDAVAGEAVLLSTGPLLPALLASAAIPGVFPPVELDGTVYVDGGIAANVPVRQAIAFGAKSLVVLDAAPETLRAKLPTSVLGSMLHASTVMLRNQRADSLDDTSAARPILRLPRVTPGEVSSFSFKHGRRLIDGAYERTNQTLHELALAPSWANLPSST